MFFKFDFLFDWRLENIAWSYASSVQSYGIFGDTVVFDTTHRLTALDMPLGIWVGMNNYGVPCFFSCLFRREENLRNQVPKHPDLIKFNSSLLIIILSQSSPRHSGSYFEVVQNPPKTIILS